MDRRAVHEEKALLPIDVTPVGIVTLTSLVHWENVPSPIDVTPGGIVIVSTAEHPLKA